MAETAADQLRRLLHIVPRLADGEEHAIDDVTRIVGAEDARALLSDLESLAERFDVPGGFVEGLQICIDSERVSLTSSHFLRPMRLTMAELCALELGLTMLRAECAPDERAPIDGATARLRKVITKLPSNDAWEGLRHAELASVESTRRHLVLLRDALTRRKKVRLSYHSGSAKERVERTVRPLRLVFSSGMWYVTAFCERSDAMRHFRLDRVLDAEMTQESFVEPDWRAIESSSDQKPLSAGGAAVMTIRYSPRIAKWILEREGGTIEGDGSLVKQYPLKELGWGVRHALQYGAEAEVLSPPELREEIVRCLAMLGSA